MNDLTTDFDNSSIQSLNFLEYQIENKILMQKIKFKDIKGNAIPFFFN